MGTSSTCRAVLDGRDCLELLEDGNGGSSRRVVGCHALLEAVARLRRAHGDDPKSWPLPTGSAHEELLLREWILKVRGEWRFPYAEDEVCHCRRVSTHTVDQAIVAGAHTPEAVSRATSASTNCGTCRPDVERILAYRLGRHEGTNE